MNQHIGLRLCYSHYFKDKPLDFSSYFIGISKEKLLEVVPFLIDVANPKHKYHKPHNMINMWFGNSNNELKKQLLDNTPNNIVLANINSSLSLLEFIVSNEFNEDNNILDAEIEINLFKAYLLLNSNQNLIEDKGAKSLECIFNTDERVTAFVLRSSYHDYELQNIDIVHILNIQLYKSLEFFKYLAEREVLRPHLDLFLYKYKCDNWRDWLKKALSLILPTILNTDNAFFDFKVEKDENYYSNCHFLDTFTLIDSTSFIDLDFIAIRTNPILKIKDGHYRVINRLFLVEKLFKSIQFQFSIQINNEVPSEFRLKNFRALHCDMFSEKTILYKSLNNIFPNKKWLKVPGETFTNNKYSAEPDFYVRFKNKVFIFESKDVVLKGEEKQSRDYLILKRALKNKFYKTKNQAKAVIQLVENIKRILSLYYDHIDDNYNPQKITIYPILVVHDRQFDSLGVNQLISMWYNKELLKLKEYYDISRVNNITIINIDTLIFYQDIFMQRGDKRLEKLISDYHNNIRFDKTIPRNTKELESIVLNSCRPFSNYVDNILGNKQNNKFRLNMVQYIQELSITSN